MVSAGVSPYRAVLGDAFDQLHPNVQRAHCAPLLAHGLIDVVHGSHRLTPFLVSAMNLPAQGIGQPVVLSLVERSCRGAAGTTEMEWKRQIGGVPLTTVQFARRGHLIEQNGAGSIAFLLCAEDGALAYEQAAMQVSGVRLPRRLCPRVRALVTPDAQGWHVQVTVALRDDPICCYEGSMRPVQASA